MGKDINISVAAAHANFRDAPQGQHKDRRVQCLHCHSEFTKNITRQRVHLDSCRQYQAIQPARPSTASSPTLNSSQRHQLDLRLARIVYFGGYPFTFYDKATHREMHDFITDCHKSYSPPTRARLAGDLLVAVYNETMHRIYQILLGQPLLNFAADESTDKAGHRIINLSVNVPNLASFNLGTYDAGDMQYKAENLANWIHEQLKKWTNNQLQRINSITFDTCKLMRSIQHLLKETPGLDRCFFLLCDSHGLNLLYKDILEGDQTIKANPQLSEWIKPCKVIQRYLKGSDLQLAILRKCQRKLYGRTRGICHTIMTRWSSHYFLVRSLENSAEALRELIEDPKAQALMKESVKAAETAWRTKVKKNPALAHVPRPPCDAEEVWQSVKSSEFWDHVRILRKLFKPIQEATIQSESENHHIGLVTKRWKEIIVTWIDRGTRNPEIKSIVEDLVTKAHRRIKLQQTADEIETLAYALDPETVLQGKEITASTNQTVCELLHKLLPKDQDEAVHQYMLFRTQQGYFAKNTGRTYDLWAEKVVKNPQLFWFYVEQAHHGLSNLARRIFSTLANSCLSERAFSAMNFTMDNNRCSLSSEKQLMVTFIYSNHKALARIDAQQPRISWNTVIEKDDEEIEEFCFAQWQEQQDPEQRATDSEDNDDEIIHEAPELPSTQSLLYTVSFDSLVPYES